MRTDEIRARFLKFFEARGHRIVPSDSLVPAKDPSILFTGAGMNQFKEQFLGRNISCRRATTSQKCIRTADLENVGRTAGHHTFFEMLGNFSFGDYFKKEAIGWAWEFLTVDLKIPKERLFASVYEEDDEAYNIWLKDIKAPKEKILKLGEKENFWPSEAKKNGPNGPCGPCSEIFYDPGKGEPIEIWNLVFTQFDRKEGGVLAPLSSKNIDTGMGLERLASVMQAVDTNFGIDIFIPIIEAIRKEVTSNRAKGRPESAKRSEASPKGTSDANINAIADHIRAIVFAIADGVYPSNEERGFVVRKLIRRSIQRALRVRAGTGPFLFKIVPSVTKAMRAAYPELERQREEISQIIKAEEERFQNIIREIVPLMKEEFAAIISGGRLKIPGEIIFKFSDEKGVPLDLQKEIAQELNAELDIDGFNEYLKGQKERSRQKSKISKEIFAAPSGLLQKEEGWDEASSQKIRMNHTATHLLHAALRSVLGAHARQSGSLVYPEKLRFDFTHPKKLDEEELRRVEELVNKNIEMGHEVKREIMSLEEAKRQAATALFGEKYTDEVIVRSIGDFSKELCSGDHVANTREIRIFKIVQEGSISAGTRRIEAITGDAVYEWLVSQALRFKEQVCQEAEGLMDGEAIACSISGKVREMEEWLEKKDAGALNYTDLRQWASLENELEDLIKELIECRKAAEKEKARQRETEIGSLAEGLIETARVVKGVKVVSSLLSGADMNSLRKLSDQLETKVPLAVILLASDFGGKANLILAVAKELVKRGLNANELIKPIAASVGGAGGGRSDLAQAGGKNTEGLKEAVEMIYKLVEERL